MCPAATTITGCCYKDCQEDIIPFDVVANTVESGDGWEAVAADLADDMEDVFETVCDFGDATCDYADSTLGKVVDRIAKVGVKLPPPAGSYARAYRNVKDSLTRAFKCKKGDSIRCEKSEALLEALKSSSATKAPLVVGMALAISLCVL